MNANELRVGNWVEANSPMMQVKEITEHTVGLYMPGSEADPFLYDIEDIRHIKLSPEILEKCGFVWSIYHQAFHKHNDGHETYDLNECYPSGYQFSTFKKQTLIGIPVQSLHQLQNLYFSLCGEELNYTQ
jgi:hypothetical protein